MDVPRLHPETIEEVKQRADIVDVVSEQVVLRKRGKDFVGLCPFHDDTSPSFTVSPSKQFYYCFSCGAGGNAITFLMEQGKRSFSEVVLDLAKRYQVPVRTLEPEKRQELQRQLSEREQLYEVLALANRFYEHALRQPQGAAALEYLQSTRLLEEETIQQFQLGYAPAGWDTLYGYLVEQKRYPVSLVEQAGLIVPRKNGSGYYDRFRDRILIPICDLQGRVVGFGGRALGDANPKYLNSPETSLFNKGTLLFGLDKARAAIAKQDRAVVVEGYFDVIALHAAGIDTAVASLGTALSKAQVKLLLRYTDSKQVVLNFDADRAGTQAAERAIGEVAELAYRGEVQLRVLNLPAGKDADEFLRTASPGEYRQLLHHAPLWLDWQLEQAIADRDLNQADQFQQSTQVMAQLLGKIPDASLRTHYIHRCAELLSQGNSRLMLQLEEDLRSQVKGQRWHGQSRKWERTADVSLREVAEAKLLRIYLHCSYARSVVLGELQQRDVEFGLSHHRFLWRQILAIEDGHDVNSTGTDSSTDADQEMPELNLIAALRDRCAKSPQDMRQVLHLLEPDELAKLDLYRAKLVVRAAAASLEKILCERRCRYLLNRWQEADRTARSARSEQADKKIVSLENSWEAQELQQRLAAEQQTAVAVEDGTAIAAPDWENEDDDLSASSEDDSDSLVSPALREAQQLWALYAQERQQLRKLEQECCIPFDDLARTPL